ncbi:MAG: peptidoglycan-binding protein [Clostridiales bacterium]|nr:peptidoglycan-binding protein [Clostridiales bacterium]
MKRKIAMMLCVCVLFASSAPLALAEATPSETQIVTLEENQPKQPVSREKIGMKLTPGNGVVSVALTGTAGEGVVVELFASENDDNPAKQTATFDANGRASVQLTAKESGNYVVLAQYANTPSNEYAQQTVALTAADSVADGKTNDEGSSSTDVELIKPGEGGGTTGGEGGGTTGEQTGGTTGEETGGTTGEQTGGTTGGETGGTTGGSTGVELIKPGEGGATGGEGSATGGEGSATGGEGGATGSEGGATGGEGSATGGEGGSTTGGNEGGSTTTGGAGTVTPITPTTPITPETPENPATPTEEDKQFGVKLYDGNLKLDVEITGGSNREVAVTLTHEDGTVTEKKETLFSGAANVSFSGLKAGVYAVKVAYTGTSNTTPFSGSVTIYDENALPKPNENTYRKIVANASVNGQKIGVQVTDSGYNTYDAASGEMKVQPKTLVVTLIGGPSTKTIKTDTAFAEFTDLPAGQYTVTVAYDDHADAALESTINGLTVAQNTQAITATATAGVKRIDVDVTAASPMSVVATLMQNGQPKDTRSIAAGVGKVSFENLAAGTYSVSVNYAPAQTGVAATVIDNLNVTEENVKIAISGVTPGENKLTVSGTAKPNEPVMISTVPDGGSTIVNADANGKFSAELARTAGTYTEVSAQYVSDAASRVTLKGTFVVTGTVTKPGLEVDDLYNNSLTVVAKTTAGVTVYLKTGDYEQTLVADNRGIVRFTLPHTYAQGTRFTLTVYYGAGNSMSYNVEATVGGTPYYKLFKRGSRGDGVYALTSRLSEMGYPVSPTNYYSDSVAAAVRLFQSANGLSADGMAGKLTQEKLYSVSAIGYSESGQTYPTLVRGDRGMALLYTLQQRLKDLGYYTIRVDGIFGSGTQRAVRWFQSVNGLSVTGKADNATQQLLYSAQAKAASGYSPDSYDTLSRSNRYKAAVVPLQRRLKALGYLSGSADGYFGSNTYRAVRNFQSRNGLSVTGVADSGTQQLLYSSSARPASGSSSSGSGSSTGYRLLYWGCRGDAVKRLQQALIDAGYKSYVRSADGIYGQWTYDAVRAYQKDVGLSVDGIAGKNTQNKLYGTKY